MYSAHETCKYSADETADLYSSGDGHHYAIVPACDLGGLATCSEDAVCAGPPPGKWYQLLRDGVEIGTVCLSDHDAEHLGGLTPARVRTAFENLTWPQSDLVIQPPDGLTLVGLDTNFYTGNTEATTQHVTLLGHRVEIEATPSSYVWTFEPGSSVETTSPGAAYPSLLVTHRYSDAGITVHPRVDTVYAGRYRIGNGPWRTITGTLTVTGEEGTLRVGEAQGVLTGDS